MSLTGWDMYTEEFPGLFSRLEQVIEVIGSLCEFYWIYSLQVLRYVEGVFRTEHRSGSISFEVQLDSSGGWK